MNRSGSRARLPFVLPESLERRVLFAAFDIIGVQAASFDQPQVHVILRDSPTGDPLGGTGPDDGVAFKAFLDTGASGMLLSVETAEGLGITHATYNGEPISFYDVGVAGAELFGVSSTLYGNLAPATSLFSGEIPVDEFDQPFGPVRFQLSDIPADFPMQPIDIIGMPALQGKVVVMDPTPLNATDISELDSMRTYVYNPGTPYNAATKTTDPGIPAVNRRIKLSYGDFSRFTFVEPTGAPGPTLKDNPFIGPNPARPAGSVDNTPGIKLSEGGTTVQGSFLLDTGAAASFMSQNIAGQLGVRYREGTYGSVDPILEYTNGQLVPNQFVIPVGGIGGTINVAGFKVDSMSVPTIEGEDIRFIDAPLLVLDIALEDPVTGQTITLDGDFGMNFLVASTAVDGSTLGDASAGAFDWITFDQPAGVLGVYLPGAGPVVPPPTVPPPPSTVGRITGVLYEDLDNDKVRDAGEPALAGRTVYLDQNNSNGLTAGERTAVTASDGAYLFDTLPAGVTYRVKQVLPTNWKQAGPIGNLHTVTFTGGQTAIGKDFGSFRTGNINGALFNDANANGTRDGTESVLAGWTVWIDMNGNGVRETGTDRIATTNASGAYSFTGLDPKAYAVRLVVQSGWRQTKPASGPINLTLASGATVASQTFGVTRRAIVSGFVFNDANRNLVKDSGETGLANWRVYIDTNKNGVFNTGERSVLTTATGEWKFTDLVAGTSYMFRVQQQTGWTRTSPTSGNYTVTPTNAQTIGGKNFGQRR